MHRRHPRGWPLAQVEAACPLSGPRARSPSAFQSSCVRRMHVDARGQPRETVAARTARAAVGAWRPAPGQEGCPGNVPARPRKADHQFVVDWIGHCNCNDGNEAGRLFGRTGSRRAQGDNDINLMLNQFNSDFTEPIRLVFSKFALEDDIVSFGVTKLSQPCDQGIAESRDLRRGPRRGRVPGRLSALSFGPAAHAPRATALPLHHRAAG